MEEPNELINKSETMHESLENYLKTIEDMAGQTKVLVEGITDLNKKIQRQVTILKILKEMADQKS